MYNLRDWSPLFDGNSSSVVHCEPNRPNLLDSCSQELRTLLLEAGWKPSISRIKRPWWRVFSKKFDLNEFNRQFEKQFARHPEHCARRIVDELFGLTLQTFQINRFWAIDFDLSIGVSYASEIIQLAEILNECLIPIGETPGEAVVVLGATGNVYLMGYVASGVFSLGHFHDAILAIITGQHWRLVEFDLETDPTGEFTLGL